jgi:hypothetical protein
MCAKAIVIVVDANELPGLLVSFLGPEVRPFPVESAPVALEPTKILPAPPAKLLPAPACELPVNVGEKSGDRGQRTEVRGQRSEVSGQIAGDDRGDGRENARPVNVTVNVMGNGGGGAGRGQKTEGRGQNRGGDGKALAAIRQRTDLIPGLVEKVDATPRRTAVLVKKAVGFRLKAVGGKVSSEQSAVSSGAISQRLREKRAAAGRKRSVVYVPGDRKAIRAEVRRVQGLGLSQAEACRQVAEQAEKGRAGTHALTMKYNLPAVTGAIVRRVFLSRR